jgi:hypothetical protein
MTAVRAVLIATIILGLAATPLVAPVFGGASSSNPTAYAAFTGGTGADGHLQAALAANNNNDNDDNFNDNGDNFNDNNDNDDNFNDNNDNNGNDNGNSNNNNDNNGNGNGNGNDNVVVIVRHPNESFNRPTKCFDTRELGTIQLGNGHYDVTVQVMPQSSFGQTTRLTLRSIDPSTVPAPTGGTLVENTVFQLDAQSSCDGAHITTLPNTVNMGVIYNTTATIDKSKLQLVMWNGSAWSNVDTVPDPTAGNPYVSTSTATAGTYALIVKP